MITRGVRRLLLLVYTGTWSALTDSQDLTSLFNTEKFLTEKKERAQKAQPLFYGSCSSMVMQDATSLMPPCT